MKSRAKNEQEKEPLIISVSSGKGGVGKSLTVVNLGLSLARSGVSTLLLDGDLGMANLDILLGVQTRSTLAKVLQEGGDIKDCIISTTYGLDLLPSGSGISELANLSYVKRRIILDQLQEVGENYRCIIIDTGAGINPNVLDLTALASKRIVVVTPEPHAITDAYALIKVLGEEKQIRQFDLIVNMAKNASEAARVASGIIGVASKFLGANVKYMGYVPHDTIIARHILRQNIGHPDVTRSMAGQAYIKLARELLIEAYGNHVADGSFEKLTLAL